MKPTAPVLAAAGAVALVALGYAGAVSAQRSPVTTLPALPAAATSPAPAGWNGPTVTVVGTGEVEGTPDTAQMTFGVDARLATAAAALRSEADAARRLISALKAAGIAEKDIQTQNVSLYRDVEHGVYDASSSVSAIMRNLGRAPGQIDAAVAAAGDQVNFQGISLYVGDTSGLMSSARQAAVRNAFARAEDYAKAAGLKVGGVVSISETGSAPPISYGAAEPRAAAMQPIQPGTQNLSVSVTITYALVTR